MRPYAKAVLLGRLFCLCALLLAGPAQAQDADANLVAGRVHLKANGARAGVTTLPSGVQYEILEPGDGRSPGPEDEVLVSYEGALIDGAVFDSTLAEGRASRFWVSGLIPGWTEVLQRMREGAAWRVWLPAELAYGAEGTDGIPPNSALVFEIELIEVYPAPPPHAEVAAMLAKGTPRPDCGEPPAWDRATTPADALPGLHDAGNRWQDCMAHWLRDTIQAFEARAAFMRTVDPATVPARQKEAVNAYFSAAVEAVADAEARLAAFQGIPRD